jgi:hypothetical protein
MLQDTATGLDRLGSLEALKKRLDNSNYWLAELREAVSSCDTVRLRERLRTEEIKNQQLVLELQARQAVEDGDRSLAKHCMAQSEALTPERLAGKEAWNRHLERGRDAAVAEHERLHAEFLAQARATEPEKCSSATARKTGDRDTVRRARPRRGARASGKGDGDADPQALARDFASLIQATAPLLVAPLTRLFATPPAGLVAAFTRLIAPRPVDPWIDQSGFPFSRVGPRLCRDAIVRGDDRAAVRGRVHYMRQSLIDEILRGSPRPKRAPNKAAPEADLSPLQKFERELDLMIAEAAE